MDNTWGSIDIILNLHQYLEYFVIYGCNMNILKFYSKELPLFTDFAEFGYFGESFRNVDYFEHLDSSAGFLFDDARDKYLNYD
ncbi:hypothetical protein [Treponema pedis]|uniref:hypothetical protein n=1 Tax=Treponema pedis TaxID=409322 RepID=UPI0012693F7C|nr:hypothetical protein [Treponema pedis]